MVCSGMISHPSLLWLPIAVLVSFVYNIIICMYVLVEEPIDATVRFTWTPQSQTEIVQGQDLILECAAQGWPTPLITWERYGGVLPSGRYHQTLGK